MSTITVTIRHIDINAVKADHPYIADDAFTVGGWMSVSSMKKANDKSGRYFFSPSTMKFHKSYVLDTIYAGRLFITSDASYNGSRQYQVRTCSDNASVYSLGEPFTSLADARSYARHLAELMKEEVI